MKPRRFYRQVSVAPAAGGAWQVVLDGNPAKTPAGNLLILPTGALAEALASEWRMQGEEIHAGTMRLTRLANTAIDRVIPNRRPAVDQLMQLAGSDLLCFRASRPEELAERQSAVWDPLLEWAADRYGVNLVTGSDLAPIRQHKDDLGTLESFILRLDDFPLTGAAAAGQILGSAVLALALLERRIGPEEAVSAAELDALYQAGIWGEDPEWLARNLKKKEEVSEIYEFLSLAAAV